MATRPGGRAAWGTPRVSDEQGTEDRMTDAASGGQPRDDLDVLAARLRSILDLYLDLVPGSVYGMATVTRPGAGAHEFFAAVRRGPSNVSFHLKPLYDHPELVETIPAALRKRLSGKQAFNFTPRDEPLIPELEALVARAYEMYRVDAGR
jgi:hypothetical protein